MVPNFLTVSRFLLTGGVIYYLNQPGFSSAVTAIVLFALASLTDYLDGFYAKKLNCVSNFGKIMDPIADKFLTLSVFFSFMRIGIVPGWIFYTIFVREIGVTAVRIVAMKKGVILAAGQAGKYKTVAQIFTIMVMLVFLVLSRFEGAGQWVTQTEGVWLHAIYIFLLMTVSLTVISGIIYLCSPQKGRKVK